MFHLHISHFRHVLKRHLSTQHAHALGANGQLSPEIEDALQGLGTDFSLNVKVPEPVTMASLKDLPVQLNIASPKKGCRLTLSGRMQDSASGDAWRTFQPQSVELGFDEEARPGLVSNFLKHLRLPSQTVGTLTRQQVA